MVRILNGEIVQDNDPRLQQSTRSPSSSSSSSSSASSGSSRVASIHSTPTPSSASSSRGDRRQPQDQNQPAQPQQQQPERRSSLGDLLLPGGYLYAANMSVKQYIPAVQLGGGIVVEPLLLAIVAVSFLVDLKFGVAALLLAFVVATGM
ncbi:hypothetical protein CAOG_06028 [Capsaspora owczarzaki ATCC 30864]|uniref:Uncharacterized protein n=1 Tax=Capsaspora owczarzaki (strain ATCC 30864) TaxID=595528 RepID=A0A0D2WT92_CAPO3|nr:hypothetical protein CAOG_06028 [Capsaspora owczarzaki ATCC 30864]KJE95590.1 hypothetical protein CAOG_006028 [Capsaspora owczarzaki ATCC 30864]|eukprot:XP_004345618.1 hypothetical protein CAOG_06028 [Capsaspora owczarzaki ATCC 30864]